jgi:steroid delta-isomerase-like uncharacterized protein
MKSITIPLIILACLLNFNTLSQIAIDTLTSAERNEQLVTDWYEKGWNNKEFEEMIPMIFAEDWTDGNPIRPDQFDGHEGMLSLVNSYYKAFPDIKFDVTHLVANDEMVAVRLEVNGTHQGEIFGVHPTGKKINTSAMVFFELENQQIKVTWQEIDLIGMLSQLTEVVAVGK